uniref:3CxxC-type domain-containing protein n=1 Tax=Oryzias latipes TaxID=8090 RepID=A0A3P9JCQ6_ORYLA
MARLTDWLPSLWMEIFNDLLDYELDNEDPWTLHFSYSITDKLTAQEKNRGWKICCTCTQAEFKCGSCGKTWFSARVMVLFRYRLRRGRGTVIMRPFGQSCLTCQDEFDLPGFARKTVEDSLVKVFSKIRKNCYMENDDNNDIDAAPSPRRYTKPHKSTLCQACKEGICKQDDNDDGTAV